MRRNHRNGSRATAPVIVSNYVHAALTALIACVRPPRARARAVITEIRRAAEAEHRRTADGRQILPSPTQLGTSSVIVLPTVGVRAARGNDDVDDGLRHPLSATVREFVTRQLVHNSNQSRSR